ncbi:MAG: peptidylprolyl isomerase [Salinarimonas sp.]|nr:peptidylprolyl isomerase [Salinarimonas sp.]
MSAENSAPSTDCSVKPDLAKAGPRNVVKVNGVVVSRAMISRETQNHPAANPVGAWKKAALALVIREALSQEVKRLGIEAEPARDSEGRRETPDEANMRALVEREIAVPQATEEECRIYYEKNRERFRAPTIDEVSHILIAADPADAKAFAAAREKAGQAIAQLREAPSLFADLARALSQCPTAREGGRLGQIGPGDTTPAFETALCAMREGEISSEPVETRYGFHVIRLHARATGEVLPFEAVRERIAEYLAEAVSRRAQAQYVAKLLARSNVEGIEVGSPGDLNVH